MAHTLIRTLAGLAIGTLALGALAQEVPDCGGGNVTFCADKAMLQALGYCTAQESLTIVTVAEDCEDLCDDDPSNDPAGGCCLVTVSVPPLEGCPTNPGPCPIGIQGLISKIANDSGIVWEPFDLPSNEPDVLSALCGLLKECCSEFGGGISAKDAINAYLYFFPDTAQTPQGLTNFFESCGANSGGAGCDDNPGPPQGPVLPPTWPNGGDPSDGPPRTDDGVNGSDGSRGGRCEGIQLTGSPSFEQFANDPSECAGGSSIGIFDIDLYSGKWAKQTVDLALPANGFGWVIGRSYNGSQQVNNGTELNPDYEFTHSNGMQGYNWRQDSLPELVMNGNQDALYLVMNAQSFVSFAPYEGTSSTFWVSGGSKNGAIIVESVASAFDSNTYSIYEVYDLTGLKMSFFGPDDTVITHATKRGQLWKIEDPAGNVAYIGHATDPGAALSSGFIEVGTGTGRYAVRDAYDTSGRLYRYAYSANPIDEFRNSSAARRLTSITIHPGGSASNPYIAKVEYGYYDYLTWTGTPGTSTPESHGLPGDLKTVRVVIPTSVGTEVVERTLYRYWTDGEDGDDPGTDPDGYDHAIKYIYASEGLRRADIAHSDGDPTTDDVASETLADLKPYAAQYMEYAADRRVKAVWGSGECGCGVAGGIGTHKLVYGDYTSSSLVPGQDGWQPWYTRTVIEFPPATPSEPSATVDSLTRWETHYFGLGGARMATVVTEDDPSTATDAWVTLTEYNPISLGAAQYTPKAILSYDHSNGAFEKATTGLVYEYIPWESTQVGGSTGVDARNLGRTRYIAWKNGDTTTISDYLSETQQIFSSATVGDGTDSVELSAPHTLYSRRYPDGGTSGTNSEETLFEYTFHTGVSTSDVESLRLKTVQVKQPGVPTGENGNGTSDLDPVKTYYRLDGTVSWVEEADGIVTYTKYDDNVPILSVQDASTSGTGVDSADTASAPTTSGSALHIVTTYAYDDQMRMTEMTLPHGRKLYEHYDVMDNGLIVNLSFPEYNGTSVSGPASFSLSGHNGAVYQSGTVAMASASAVSGKSGWVDQDETGAFTAFAGLGTLARLSEMVYDEPGDKAIASRTYYDIDGTTGNQFDETTYGYDDMGRMVRMEAPHGTITRTTFDDLGRPVAQWMGTDDDDFPSGSGTSDNMTRISTTEYDGDGVGNGLVSKTRAYTNGTLYRETGYLYDVRNRLIVQLNPLAPHSVYQYDNLDRVTHAAMYGSSSGLTAATVASTATSNRVSLSETKYDTRGRVYESLTFEIVQSTGAKANSGNNFLFSRTWYDPVGQVIKTTGRSLSKTVYDRLRRPTAMYALSSTNDSAYADADDVSGDTVVTESHTLWDNESGLALAAMRVDRHPGDTMTGALYDPTSPTSVWDEGEIRGRVQISAMWYDGQDRLTHSVDYGTADLDADDTNETFDRLATGLVDPPDPTDLVGASLEDGHFVISLYNADGEVEVVSVPNDETGETSPDWVVKTKTVYDDAGRVVQRIENWDGNSSPTPALPDVNRITELTYENGLMEFQIARNAMAGPSVENQVTRYVYGSTKGTGYSDVATGHLLRIVYYPDATDVSGNVIAPLDNDAIFYFYNAQGQRKKTIDQEGNIIEMDFDDRGRTIARRVENVASDFDGFVRRISTVYDTTRGLVQSVDQYGDVSGTTLRDSVDFTYDDWGNLATSAQDPDSTSALTVTYAHALSAGEISTLRRTSVTYPNGAQAAYDYDTGLDANLSRASTVRFKPTSAGSPADIADYTYGGAASLLKTVVYSGSSSYHTAYYDTTDQDGYAHLDRFNRPTKSYWAHGTASTGLKYHEVNLFYDVASNIREINDEVTGRDTDLGVDDFRRLTSSEVDTNGTVGWELDQEIFTYDHLGNWQSSSYDAANGGSVDLVDDRIFNRVNEMTDRDLQILGAGAVAKDPVYDATGNMTDDGRYYEYTYDVFGRITQVEDDTGVVAKYRYNGLFQRTITTTDRDGNSSVTGEYDYHQVYDDRWRVIAIYRKDGSTRDSAPKEVTVYHAAGMGGSSSPLDSVIARYRSDDADLSTHNPYTDWDAAADGDMDKRLTYFQNWRGDVVFVSGGTYTERIEYSPYGVPSSYVSADQNLTGDVTPADFSAWTANFNSGSVIADVNFDGSVAPADYSAWAAANSLLAGTVGGRGALSPWADNKIGYAGYRLTDQTLTTVWHVRFREFVPEMGVWTRRDPLGYVDGPGLYTYAMMMPIMYTDFLGLACGPCQCGNSCGEDSSANGRPTASDFTLQPHSNTDSIKECIKNCVDNWPYRDYRGWTLDANASCKAQCEESQRPKTPRDPTKKMIVCWRIPGGIRHCEIQTNGCQSSVGKGHNDCVEYPILPDRDPSRQMPDGVPCDQATESQIQQCLMPGWPRTTTTMDGYLLDGDNCQGITVRQLIRCCGRTPWIPSWYAPNTVPCLEWATPNGPGGAAVCVEWDYCWLDTSIPMF